MPEVLENLKSLLKKAESKMVLLVADGLGGVPHPDFGYQTELEAARTPNLDELAKKSALGLMTLVNHGITPGSGPGHIGLFGYNPEELTIGRGVLEALGVGFHLQPGDIAARANFATRDERGIIVDRRAGRISTEECTRLVEKISREIKEIEGVEIILRPGMEHRFVLILRGEGLKEGVRDTDPQKEGLPPYEPQALDAEAEKTARVLKLFLEKAHQIIKDEPKANTILMRGFSQSPHIEKFPERYGVRALAIAVYPMYKGISRLFGFDTPDVTGDFQDEVKLLRDKWFDYDFFFLHYKDTDKAGEDGDFKKKVDRIEHLDQFIPQVLALRPDVLAITGDHSTPSLLHSHSWHPSPVLLYSKYAGVSTGTRFTEKECAHGYLGQFPSRALMSLMLANALRLGKFGA
ncbi:MAG TPA: 2,3-bisphosphoglycerate-independent phosphoglycerate mutase [Candidatus Atribacteria bacterium]|jgi:2,3-bisphosphoglycerate-independent phosphoglycerate mutase|uniref:2,3-bisphosphoglycerate-independent phosphoglycerate mutase n=1 Tax=Candidatus Sordicultor fermentans TaxID=1953203 RepID=UPI0016AF80C8|nr:2,3-bisphosphoglycerate-independent phosphoglycerate mutase [Atribacterota bacterium]NLY04631.1 2,3-bisphosphoglycerate-independent phosphoglycerate mutase [Candidatus Atribacteria bacterium]MDI9607616.1 2,3-bisphosphoglycerate-independent phosphoglycerate mutase [Atribacterota bacterium]MDY0134904.1 2,3-bisphosphoglycerate-independent phosphoglycerate mutase [Atribacterota bacterium]HOA98550.1 2,3-bisphosphoglycerate-independent phosphoglycerate mutase [Candidatus Atribacteria bacterium]